jgi:hypothetical protein
MSFWRRMSRTADRVDRLPIGDLSLPFLVPSEGTFGVDAVLLPMWKRAVQALPDAHAAKLITTACGSKSDLGTKAEIIQALLLPCAAEVRAEVARLSDRCLARDTARVEAMGPRLPEERRLALLTTARTQADDVAAMLCKLRERFLSMADGGSLLLKLAQSVDSGHSHGPDPDGASRGAEHELRALEWASDHWPGCVVISNSTVIATSHDGHVNSTVIATSHDGHVGPPHAADHPFLAECRSKSPPGRQMGGRGLKQEFDVLVARSSRVRPPEAATDEGEAIDEALELIAVVEANAGEPLFSDLPKLIEARELFFSSGSTVRICDGDGNTHALRVGHAPVHLCYLFGRARETLAELACSSAATYARHVLLDRELCRPCPSLTLVRESGAPTVHAVFEDTAAIAEAQASFERFREHLAALVESGELSCWCWRVEVDASDP